VTVAATPRVAFINDWWAPDLVGGAERSAAECADHAARNGFEVVAFVPAHHDATDWQDRVLVRRVARFGARRSPHGSRRVHGVEFLMTWLNPQSARRLARQVAAFRPDVVSVHNVQRIHPSLFRALRASGVTAPILRVVHDLSDICWRRTRCRDGEPCERTCLPCHSKRALSTAVQRGQISAVLANSRYVADTLDASGIFQEVPLAVGSPGLRQALELRRSHPPTTAGSRPPTFGFIGRVTPEKGVFVALEAVALLRESLPEATLVIAGPADEVVSARLIQRAKDLAVPLRLLEPTQITEFASMIDVALAPSLWPEPFGRVALELAALNVPIVVADRGGLPEAARAIRGATLCVVSPKNPRVVSQATLSLYNHGPRSGSFPQPVPFPETHVVGLEDAWLEIVQSQLRCSASDNFLGINERSAPS
jgi:glycosyltransferase involved in cell wall biosynthesis